MALTRASLNLRVTPCGNNDNEGSNVGEVQLTGHGVRDEESMTTVYSLRRMKSTIFHSIPF